MCVGCVVGWRGEETWNEQAIGMKHRFSVICSVVFRILGGFMLILKVATCFA